MIDMSYTCRKNNLTINLRVGDITDFDGDAIVNPANTLMIMGGGVAGAIKRVAGDEVEKEALKYAPVPVGSAIATSAGKMKNVKYIIHSPTMERPAMRTSVEKVRAAVKAALMKAKELGIKDIAFPGMGTGVGGVPYNIAAKVMYDEIANFIKNVGSGSIERILLVAYRDELFKEFCKVIKGSQEN